MWGYVRGGMGMVSFYFCDAAREAGATVISGVPVARILPGEGIELEGGERIAARTVISNADPRQTLRLLGTNADTGWRSQVERVPSKDAPSSSTSTCASCQISRPAQESTSPITTAKSMLRSQKKSGRPALPQHVEANCRASVVRALLPKCSRSFHRPAGEHHHERVCAVCSV